VVAFSSDFDVSQEGRVVDRDVHVLPAGEVAAVTVISDAAACSPSLTWLAGEAMPSAAMDPPDLLDIDVQQLARSRSLVAFCGLQPEPAEFAHPDPGQDPRHGRDRHPEALGDLSAAHPQPTERSDHLEAPLIGAVGHHDRSRGAIHQPSRPFQPVPGQPLARGAVTDSGRVGGLRQRPPRIHAIDQQLAALDAEASVTVQLRPVSSLGLSGVSTPQPPRSTGWLAHRRNNVVRIYS
jgi:hypothetical protein